MIVLLILAGWLIQPVIFDWTPADGPVVTYDVACLDGNEVWATCAEQVAEPTVEFRDLGIGQSIQVRVRALDAQGNVGPPSLSSEVVRRLPNFDWNRDGRFGQLDLGPVKRAIANGLADISLMAYARQVWGQSICGGVYRRGPCP